MIENYSLGDIFEKDGYKFIVIKANHVAHPYRVRLIGSTEEADSSYNYHDAADTIIGHKRFANEKLEHDSKNREYVHNAFWNALRGKKKRECDEVINCEVQRMISSRIELDSIEQSNCLAYQTDHFFVKVLFENGTWRPVTKVEVIAKRTDINAV
jgi:hypothetical protein